MGRMHSLSHLKQMGLALHNYHSVWGAFPPGASFDRWGQPLHGWQSMLLASLDQTSIYNQINFQVAWNGAQNRKIFQSQLFEYNNPGGTPVAQKNAAGYAFSHYAGNIRVLGGDKSLRVDDFKDGTAQTIMAGEVATGFKPWGDPLNWRDPALGVNRSPEGFGSTYQEGAQFLFADGSVRFIKNSVSLSVMKALSTPASGEQVTSDEY